MTERPPPWLPMLNHAKGLITAGYCVKLGQFFRYGHVRVRFFFWFIGVNALNARTLRSDARP